MAAAGLIKIDLLGLGILSALHTGCDLIAEHHGVRLSLASIPRDDPAVHRMIARGDTIGVFQVDSVSSPAVLPSAPREPIRRPVRTARTRGSRCALRGVNA
ncbi:hypothetical protein [Streptomyces lutosisoli]|uniref:DNA polymerase III alpha subunit finger domain-containing protein n=1 Tax=Streptomyces lutosisoli TaxID=2665721 RepID=A0ABW2VUQ3_9ACTN